MLNECKPALLPLGGTSRVAKCYSTLIANLLKISSSRASPSSGVTVSFLSL